jgi:uncharacterized protein with von Willebrand factor type A (vWA) domain
VRLRTIELDLAATAAAFERRLRDTGLPVGSDHAARFAAALAVTRPIARRRLYWTARAVFVSDRTQVAAFDAVFSAVFGARRDSEEFEPDDDQTLVAAPEQEPAVDNAESVEVAREAPGGRAGASAPQPEDGAPAEQEVPVPVLASDEEVLRAKHFDRLEPDELAQLHRLMTKLELATPRRRTRRSERRRHGSTIDMRRTLRGSMRTAGDPIRLARRERRMVPRRIVLLCDISGSMEPYARAYLQFLVCAAGAGPRAEAFVFATRLSRVTRALASRNPDRAIQQAAAAAPDWSSGTRIGDALKEFNDRHGRRGMARGAVVVILSDGWERGDPSLVAREVERLRRLAYRIVWVNPRVAATEFAPRAGGMAAALPFCDALLSGHSLGALEQVADAIAAARWMDTAPGAAWRPEPPQTEDAETVDEWPSATPVPGSSVAMPSGYGPSRGRTTPGWSIGDD